MSKPVQTEIAGLAVAGNPPPPRPRVTDDLIRAAAAELIPHLRADESAIDDLMDVYGAHRDGYEVAKALDDDHGWSITTDMVETLDTFGSRVDALHTAECRKWAQAFHIQPPLPVGTVITRGLIEGVAGDHSPATYLVKEPNCTVKGRHLLVRFEDAKPV